MEKQGWILWNLFSDSQTFKLTFDLLDPPSCRCPPMTQYFLLNSFRKSYPDPEANPNSLLLPHPQTLHLRQNHPKQRLLTKWIFARNIRELFTIIPLSHINEKCQKLLNIHHILYFLKESVCQTMAMSYETSS